MTNPLLIECEGYKWAMEPTRLKSFVEFVAEHPLSENLAAVSISAKPREIRMEGTTAIVPISGVLLKTVPMWVRWWGLAATGYDEIQQMIGAAVNNGAVENIRLQIDSPGGQVDGLVEAADAIFAARQSKTVTATIEDLGASAAYWLASQAENITAGRNTEVGSIGIYSVYVDYSKMADDMGAKVIVIRSGPHKGMGVTGAPITDEQVAAVQKIIDAMADNFIGAVSAGRGMESDRVKELATGQLWIAADAKKRGLIDEVTQSNVGTESGDNDNAESESKNKSGVDLMDDEKKTEVDVEQIRKDAQESALNDERERVAALNKEFADDPAFAVKATQEGWTLAEAKAEYCDVLKEKLAAQPKADNKVDGVPPIASDGSGDGETGADFIAAARELAEEKNIGITAAMRRLKRRNPAGYAKFRHECEMRGQEMYAEAV